MKYSPRSKRLSGINVYMTNTPTDIVPMGQVHDWYSLRWQIEILFKTWKSFFHIHHCKNKTRTIGMPFVWTIDCHSTLFLYYVSNAEITSHKEETRAE